MKQVALGVSRFLARSLAILTISGLLMSWMPLNWVMAQTTSLEQAEFSSDPVLEKLWNQNLDDPAPQVRPKSVVQPARPAASSSSQKSQTNPQARKPLPEKAGANVQPGQTAQSATVSGAKGVSVAPKTLESKTRQQVVSPETKRSASSVPKQETPATVIPENRQEKAKANPQTSSKTHSAQADPVQNKPIEGNKKQESLPASSAQAEKSQPASSAEKVKPQPAAAAKATPEKPEKAPSTAAQLEKAQPATQPAKVKSKKEKPKKEKKLKQPKQTPNSLWQPTIEANPGAQPLPAKPLALPDGQASLERKAESAKKEKHSPAQTTSRAKDNRVAQPSATPQPLAQDQAEAKAVSAESKKQAKPPRKQKTAKLPPEKTEPKGASKTESPTPRKEAETRQPDILQPESRPVASQLPQPDVARPEKNAEQKLNTNQQEQKQKQKQEKPGKTESEKAKKKIKKQRDKQPDKPQPAIQPKQGTASLSTQPAPQKTEAAPTAFVGAESKASPKPEKMKREKEKAQQKAQEKIKQEKVKQEKKHKPDPVKQDANQAKSAPLTPNAPHPFAADTPEKAVTPAASKPLMEAFPQAGPNVKDKKAKLKKVKPPKPVQPARTSAERPHPDKTASGMTPEGTVPDATLAQKPGKAGSPVKQTEQKAASSTQAKHLEPEKVKPEKLPEKSKEEKTKKEKRKKEKTVKPGDTQPLPPKTEAATPAVTSATQTRKSQPAAQPSQPPHEAARPVSSPPAKAEPEAPTLAKAPATMTDGMVKVHQLTGEYVTLLGQWQQSSKKQGLEPVLDKGQEAAVAILKVADNLTDADFKALEAQLPGYLMIRNEILVIAPDPAFFLGIAKQKGKPVDIAFFDLMRQTLNGYWPTTMEQLDHLSGCSRFGSGELVRLYGGWKTFERQFPHAYQKALQDPNLLLRHDIEDQLLNGDSACEGPDSVIQELERFVVTYPKSELTPQLQKRIETLKQGKSNISFKQGVKYRYAE